jgi:hypothetical protein
LSRHNSTTGLNHRTESLEEAIAFDAEQAKVLERVHAAEAAAGIVRQIRDESGAFAVWIGVEEAKKAGCANSWIKQAVE